MDEQWFSEYAEELARCLDDARACAETCERLLATLDGHADPVLRRAVAAVVPPVAVSRVLIDLIDRPAQLLSAARLCADVADHAVESLEPLGDTRTAAAVAALRTCAASCAALVEIV
jgi:hypothetical protein